MVETFCLKTSHSGCHFTSEKIGLLIGIGNLFLDSVLLAELKFGLAFHTPSASLHNAK